MSQTGEGMAVPDAPTEEAGATVPETTSDQEGTAANEGEEALPPLVPVLEAALFASAESVPLTRLTRVLGAWTRKQVHRGELQIGRAHV